jgi:hypothetical protein
MSERFSMKFTGSHSNKRIVPVMKLQKVISNPNPVPTQQRITNGTLLSSSWRAAYGNAGNSFPIKKSCGCGG